MSISQWCHPTVSSSVILFLLPLIFPASESFRMSRFFTSGGQSTGASASVFLMNTKDWFLLGLTGLISLLSKGLSRVFHSTTIQKHQFFDTGPILLYDPTLTSIHDHWKNHSLTRLAFVRKVMSLLFNMPSRLVITFLSRSKHLLMSWLQSSSAVILEPPKIVSHSFHCFPIYLPWSDGTGCHYISFLKVEL